jgi:outer membrane protein OmpU
MNKLTKIGASALCGSLAVVASANAGSLAVTGGATATYVTLDGEVTGNPFGMATGMTFTGTGELDNGSTVKLSIAHTNKAAYTGSAISVTTPTLGTFTYDEGGGTGLDRIDDMMPTAWEEVDGTGLAMGLQTVAGAGGNSDIEWNVGMGLPDGMNAYISFAAHPDGTKNANKGASGTAADSGVVDGYGYDVVVTHSGLQDGLNVFAGYSNISQVSRIGDRTAHAFGATYAVGGITLGYQYSSDNNPGTTGDTADMYENNAYGISFAVNDDLSISYGYHESEQHQDDASNITLEGTSIQASYTVGGASIKFAETSVDNQKYQSGTNRDGRTIALTLAF